MTHLSEILPQITTVRNALILEGNLRRTRVTAYLTTHRVKGICSGNLLSNCFQDVNSQTILYLESIQPCFNHQYIQAFYKIFISKRIEIRGNRPMRLRCDEI